MEGCRLMSTPMTTNFRKLDASKSELVDPTLYRQLIVSLMYLVSTRPDISFVVNTPMATPMTTNFRKLDASESELVDPTLYRQLIGSLMYLVNTRLDISFVVNTLSQYMVEPRRVQWSAAKHVLRYVVGTVDYGLDYVRGDGVGLVRYSDSDWAGSASDRRVLQGVVSDWVRLLFPGSAGSKIWWH